MDRKFNNAQAAAYLNLVRTASMRGVSIRMRAGETAVPQFPFPIQLVTTIDGAEVGEQAAMLDDGRFVFHSEVRTAEGMLDELLSQGSNALWEKPWPENT